MSDKKREDFFIELEDLYNGLNAQLSDTTINPCGSCRKCCTGKGLTSHRVTALELDYIADKVGVEKLDTFKKFLRRDGTIEVCPYFDPKSWGCGIYPYRPYSCRIFGHYKAKNTLLPQDCIYIGHESEFEAKNYYSSVPLAQELRELTRTYWPYRQDQEVFSSNSRSEPSKEDSDSLSFEGDALDRALSLMADDKLQLALEVLEESDLKSTPYVLYCLSLVFEGLKRYQDACAALRTAVEQAPSCAQLWFRLACNLFYLNKVQESLAAFKQTIALNPGHALAHGMLGSLYLSQKLPNKAAKLLERALELDPDNSFFKQALAQASLSK